MWVVSRGERAGEGSKGYPSVVFLALAIMKVRKRPAADLRRTAAQRAPCTRHVGRPAVYVDGLTKRQRYKNRVQGHQAPAMVAKPIKVRGATCKTVAAPIQQLEARFGAKPPPSLQDLFLTSVEQTTLHTLFRKVVQILTEARIPYILDAGTLLGWARLQTFLPWDDDLDLCIPQEHENCMRACNWEGSGLQLVRADIAGLWKVSPVQGAIAGSHDIPVHLNGRSMGTCRPWRWPAVDIFVMQVDCKTPGAERHYTRACKKLWPKFAMDRSFSTQRATLDLAGGSLQVHVPRRYAAYLDAAFGCKWRTIAKVPEFDHRQHRFVHRSAACKAAQYEVGGRWALLQ